MVIQTSFTRDLVNAQLKVTRSRVAILKILQAHNKPLDVSDILTELRGEGIDTNQATVYRILDLFSEKGIVQRLELQEGKYRYELSGSDHHHLVCESCGNIEDISDCNIPAFEKEIALKKRFLVKRHSLEFFGLCQNCQR